jgi:beta-glucosidase
MAQVNGDKFLWGVATSAFQMEGHTRNDMTDWENAGRFRSNGKDPRIGVACNHWNRWQEDFQLLKELGVNSYRFSLEWSRIEPEPGRFDQSALDQYDRMIDRLLELGITPMLTLHHFTHPTWFHNQTPWHKSESVLRFVYFCRMATKRLLDRVPYIVTINEPLVWTLAGYGVGKFPPGEKNMGRVMKALHNMLLAHRQVYDMVKDRNPECQVGIAHNFVAFKRAPKGHEIDRLMKRMVHYFYNWMIIRAFRKNNLRFRFPVILFYDEPIALDDKIDFWGVNYYYRLHVRFRLSFRRPFHLLSIPRSSGEGQSDLGWEIYPTGLRKVCKWVSATGKPIIITENGIAVADDATRIRFLQSHLGVLEELIREGYPIKGYYHWTLIDNYEWLIGKSARFGLYHVDFDNSLSRKLKSSGQFYRDYINRFLAADVRPPETH